MLATIHGYSFSAHAPTRTPTRVRARVRARARKKHIANPFSLT